MSVPETPKKTQRAYTIAKALEDGAAVAQSQRNILQLELERQEVEERLNVLTEQIDRGVQDLSDHFTQMGVGVAEMNTWTSPPTTPRHTKMAARSTPGTPRVTLIESDSDSEQTSHPIRAKSAKAEIPQTSEEDPVYPGSKYPAYVLHAGKQGAHGVFYSWRNHGQVQGVKHLVDEENHNHVVRGFSSRDLAHQFYQEFVDAELPKFLALEEPSEAERFIVLEGVKPMVCANRKSLIMSGLQYRGGVVRRYHGTLAGAWSEFRRYKDNGEVKVTHKGTKVL
ncbi:hypothetical protein C8R42DRAFT_637085 [Lentinula raphanica]|nr:hypothetical protein C8R42DRAFT_637085 [Lentinula raphanica]